MKLKFVTSLLVASILSSNLYAQSLTRPAKDLERDKSSKGQQVIQLSGITEGMKVLDLLGGAGYYSELLSGVVGQKGSVLLHNNQAYMPYVEKQLHERLQNNRLANVTRFDRELEQLNLSKGELDGIFFVLGYHDIYHVADGWKVDRDKLLNQISSSIKQGGKLVIVDHAAKVGTGIAASQELHRIDKSYVIDELKGFGFSLVTDSNLLANPSDDHSLSPFNPDIRRKTDRFLLVFEKQ